MYTKERRTPKNEHAFSSETNIRHAIKAIKLQEALDSYDEGTMTYMIKDGEVIRKATRDEVTKMLIREMRNKLV